MNERSEHPMAKEFRDRDRSNDRFLRSPAIQMERFCNELDRLHCELSAAKSRTGKVTRQRDGLLEAARLVRRRCGETLPDDVFTTVASAIAECAGEEV